MHSRHLKLTLVQLSTLAGRLVVSISEALPCFNVLYQKMNCSGCIKQAIHAPRQSMPRSVWLVMTIDKRALFNSIVLFNLSKTCFADVTRHPSR